MTSEQLEAKIKARNKVNQYALEIGPRVIEALKPFIGQKVCNVGGELSKKVMGQLPALQNEFNIRAFYSTGHGYTVTVQLNASETTRQGHAMYCDATVYVANLRNGILESMFPDMEPADWRTDYTVDEYRALEKQIRDAESTLSTLRSKFGCI